ncbi:MAG: glutaredoxin 3 [Burkholderiales bacterium]
MPSIRMYATDWCPYCQRAEALLRSKGVTTIDKIDIDRHPEQKKEMIAKTGRRTVPQIFIGERHIGGCDDLHALDSAGALDPLLAS